MADDDGAVTVKAFSLRRTFVFEGGSESKASSNSQHRQTAEWSSCVRDGHLSMEPGDKNGARGSKWVPQCNCPTVAIDGQFVNAEHVK